MKKIYITSTLRFDWNLKFNPQLCEILEQRGIDCYLPQRDTNQSWPKENIFQQDINGIDESEQVLCIALNESVNWGGEVGYAFGTKKRIVALKSKDHEIPLILKYMISDVIEVDNIDNIEGYIDELVQKINK